MPIYHLPPFCALPDLDFICVISNKSGPERESDRKRVREHLLIASGGGGGELYYDVIMMSFSITCKVYYW